MQPQTVECYTYSRHFFKGALYVTTKHGLSIIGAYLVALIGNLLIFQNLTRWPTQLRSCYCDQCAGDDCRWFQ